MTVEELKASIKAARKVNSAEYLTPPSRMLKGAAYLIEYKLKVKTPVRFLGEGRGLNLKTQSECSVDRAGYPL